MPTNNESKYIKEVWAENLEEEMAVLRDLVEQYPFLAMDTEFPGVVARPIGSFRTSSDYHYQTLRCNVDLLKIIQLGITFADENGTLPPDTCTWQFNFKFNLGGDMYAQDSIDLLTKSGIDFKKHEDYGIDVEHFGELLISSGFVLLDDVKWISYHSGYDFGYLLKVLTCSPLPAEESEFFDLLRTYFPCIYDIKFLVRSFKNLKGGLQDIADDLQVTRIGPQHQAGSDSLLTATTFFKMRQTFFNDKIDDTKYLGYLYGLGTTTNVPNVMIGTPPILNNNVSIVNSIVIIIIVPLPTLFLPTLSQSIPPTIQPAAILTIQQPQTLMVHQLQ
ncbi:1290_t:CDS:2 [Funneliformis caledonium]|uniref:poly(A)-specific ribonuclease n=1 Tax=Funneliformis caledonium TaxID=1117310 RepID=A0A9N8VTM7_9GLOM|nr:1290_t:CDS:2 [Funneliformis caledonium]